MPLASATLSNTSATTDQFAATSTPSFWVRLGYNWLLVLGHLGLLATLYVVLYYAGIVQQLPSAQNLMKWDVGWYHSVLQDGYSYKGNHVQNNVAFFPLFPYCWRVSGLGLLGISIFNMLVASVGISLLTAVLKCSRWQTMLLTSVPLLMFTLVPYTEAFFYLFGAVLLAGLHRQQIGLLALGMLGCCLTRPAATFLVPALVGTELLAWLGTYEFRPALRNLTVGVGCAVLGIGSVAWLQYERTGVWLAFYKAQIAWDHWWHWPQPGPLYSKAGQPMLWLDGLSLGIGIACFSVLSLLAVRQLKQRGRAIAPARIVTFSRVYCALIIFFILFQQGGNLANASRYLLGTPFFAVVVWGAWQRTYRRGSWALLVGVLALVAYLLGFPAHVSGYLPGQTFWYVGLMGSYAAMWLLAGAPSQRPVMRRVAGGALYCLNLVMLSMLLNWFLQGVWLG